MFSSSASLGHYRRQKKSQELISASTGQNITEWNCSLQHVIEDNFWLSISAWLIFWCWNYLCAIYICDWSEICTHSSSVRLWSSWGCESRKTILCPTSTPPERWAKTTSQKAYVGVSLANVNFFNLSGMLVLHLDKSCVSIHIFLFCLSI